MEEAEKKEVAAMIDILSALHMQLQEVEDIARERAWIFREEAADSEGTTGAQFYTGWHLLREVGAEVQGVQEHIEHLVDFLRTGIAFNPRSGDTPPSEGPTRQSRAQIALRNAARSFEKASDALYVVGRALEAEDLGVYADHLHTLSESVEAEAKRARSALESVESERP